MGRYLVFIRAEIDVGPSPRNCMLEYDLLRDPTYNPHNTTL